MGGDVLCRETSLDLAFRAYESMLSVAATPYLQYAEHVAELSQVLMSDYANKTLLLARPGVYAGHDVESAWHGGLLHAAILGSNVTFEDLADAANLDVTRAVALLTPDHRLPYARRTQLLYNGLYDASDMVKLVKLAERTECLLAWSFCLQFQQPPHFKATLSQLRDDLESLARLLMSLRIADVRSSLTWCFDALSVLENCARRPESSKTELGALRAHPFAIPATCWPTSQSKRKRKCKS